MLFFSKLNNRDRAELIALTVVRYLADRRSKNNTAAEHRKIRGANPGESSTVTRRSRLLFLPLRKKATVISAFGALLFGTLTYGGTTPKNLANGLYEVVQQSQPLPAVARSLTSKLTLTTGLKKRMVWDKAGKIKVDIYLDGSMPFTDLSRTLREDKELTVTDESSSYQAGVIEGYVTPLAAVRIAKMAGVRSLSAVIQPIHHVGAVTTQGFYQHNVDKIASRFDGTGISIGVLSDTFNAAGGPITAETDISTGDLPGPGNPLGNSNPVTVLQESDTPFPTDEGRAMLQIVHDLAPNAKLAFATADGGPVNFSNNIRRLHDSFKADIIIDDASYLDEPLFQDGIIAQAVDEVAAKGVAYFAAAGNQSSMAAYASALRRVPFDPSNPSAIVAGTNLDLSQVDPALYIGGFHNFRSDGGQDIAQSVFIDGGDPSTPLGTAVTLQWNDVYLGINPKSIRLILNGTGTLPTQASFVDYSFTNPTPGAQVRFDVYGTSTDLDVILQLIDPSGHVVATQDNSTGETLFSFLPTAGIYTLRVSGFEGETGAFSVKIHETDGKPLVSTDLNLLVFDADGKFLLAVADNNIATNVPAEIAILNLPTGTYQFAYSYGNIPSGPNIADQVRFMFVNPQVAAYPVEYFSIDTPSILGHCAAIGANAVGAYSAFRPYIPEDSSARGPCTTYFDAVGNRLPLPEIRQKPDISAMDGGNTTFFVSDSSRDADTFPNFFGTSASAPHAGAIAALVLQAKGGPGSVTPHQLSRILKGSAFPHDLDPYKSTGIAAGPGGILFAVVNGTDDFNSQIDRSQFTFQYFGSSAVSSLTINLKSANPTGGNIYNPYPGEVFDIRPPVEELDLINMNGGFPFTLGPSIGITPNDVMVAYREPAPAPSVVGQFFELDLTFRPNKFTRGSVLRFGIDRDEWHSAYVPSPTGTGGGVSLFGGSADLLGDGVLIPSGLVLSQGATLNGRFQDGSRFSGRFYNLIGPGYSPIDGWGFVNAQTAVGLVNHDR